MADAVWDEDALADDSESWMWNSDDSDAEDRTRTDQDEVTYALEDPANNAIPIGRLPDEMLGRVFVFLDLRSALSRVPSTCRRWQRVSSRIRLTRADLNECLVPAGAVAMEKCLGSAQRALTHALLQLSVADILLPETTPPPALGGSFPRYRGALASPVTSKWNEAVLTAAVVSAPNVTHLSVSSFNPFCFGFVAKFRKLTHLVLDDQRGMLLGETLLGEVATGCQRLVQVTLTGAGRQSTSFKRGVLRLVELPSLTRLSLNKGWYPLFLTDASDEWALDRTDHPPGSGDTVFGDLMHMVFVRTVGPR